MEEIKRLIDKRYNEFDSEDYYDPVYKAWFYNFAEFFKRSNLSDEQIKEAIKVMMDNRSLDNMDDADMLDENFSLLIDEENFFKYLESIYSRITPQYVLDGIEFAKQNLQFNSNFIDSFIKYIVTTNFQDVHVDSDIPKLKKGEKRFGQVSCNLGEFPLADLIVRENEDSKGRKNIQFDGVSTRRNLRNTKIGALLFRKLQGDVAQYFPGYDLYANTVDQENYGGIRFYKSMGAKILNTEDDEYDADDYYDDPDNDYYYYYIALFPAAKLQELSEIPVEPPQLEYYTNLQTEKSAARELREYMNKIIQMQKQHIDAGKDIPVNLRIPEQIELSPRNLDYLLESETVDFIGEGKTEEEMQFFWKKTEEYPELELRIKRNNKGKYVLTYIRERSMDGKEDFIWDSQEKEGKKGILIVSREDDALNEIIDIDR
mgnify:CR=1 FL=1